jgi:hypothetical protein
MSETRKLAAILVADVVGYSRLAGTDEDRTLARLRGLRSDLIDPAIAAHRGRIVKRTGDGSIIEFAASSTRSVARSKCACSEMPVIQGFARVELECCLFVWARYGQLATSRRAQGDRQLRGWLQFSNLRTSTMRGG